MHHFWFLWRNKNEGFSISFLGVSFSTSPLISIIYMTSHESKVVQIGFRQQGQKLTLQQSSQLRVGWSPGRCSHWQLSMPYARHILPVHSWNNRSISLKLCLFWNSSIIQSSLMSVRLSVRQDLGYHWNDWIILFRKYTYWSCGGFRLFSWLTILGQNYKVPRMVLCYFISKLKFENFFWFCFSVPSLFP